MIYGEFELFQRAMEMGVRGIPELICGGDIKNDIVVVDTITLAEELNALHSFLSFLFSYGLPQSP